MVVEGLLPVLRSVATETGAGSVLVEQHVRPALEIADRGLVLAHGERVLEGAASDLLLEPGRLEAACLAAVPA